MLRFLKVREEHLEMILEWRTSPDITRYMFTDVPKDMAHQRAWFASLPKKDHYRQWLISYENRPIGLASLANIDWRSRHASIGYYVGEADVRPMGFMIPPFLLNHFFHDLKLRKITAENMDGNERIMQLNDRLGFRKVGVYEKHLEKNGKLFDIHLYELLDSAWESLKHRYGRCVAPFEDGAA